METGEELPAWSFIILGAILGGVFVWFVAMSSDSTCSADMDYVEETMKELQGGSKIGSSVLSVNKTVNGLINTYFSYNGAGTARATAQPVFNRVCKRNSPPVNMSGLKRLLR